MTVTPDPFTRTETLGYRRTLAAIRVVSAVSAVQSAESELADAKHAFDLIDHDCEVAQDGHIAAAEEMLTSTEGSTP